MSISTVGDSVVSRFPYPNSSGTINYSFEATTLVPECAAMTLRNDGKVQYATSDVPGIFVGIVKVRNTAANMRVTLTTPFMVIIRCVPTEDIVAGDPIKFTGLDTEQTVTPASVGQWAQAVALESAESDAEFVLIGVLATAFKVEAAYTS